MVDLLETDEQRQIVGSIAAFLGEEMPLGRLGAPGRPAQADYRLFGKMAELGWFGLGLSEAEGGVGGAAVEEALLFRELGRVLAPPSLIATSLAARVAIGCADPELASRVIRGEAIVAAAVPIGAITDSPCLEGRIQVLDAQAASHVLLLGETACALVEIARVGPLAPGQCADDALSLDVCRASVPKAALSVTAVAAIWRRARLLSAAMLAGICEAARDLASEYARTREQFGQPIGVFQAVKHKCSDMAIRADAVNAQVAFASICVRDERPDASFQVAAAKLLGARYALLSAKDAIQVHGAIGATTALPVHLLLKRANVLDQFLGGGRAEQSALMREPAPQSGGR